MHYPYYQHPRVVRPARRLFALLSVIGLALLATRSAAALLRRYGVVLRAACALLCCCVSPSLCINNIDALYLWLISMIIPPAQAAGWAPASVASVRVCVYHLFCLSVCHYCVSERA